MAPRTRTPGSPPASRSTLVACLAVLVPLAILLALRSKAGAADDSEVGRAHVLLLERRVHEVEASAMRSIANAAAAAAAAAARIAAVEAKLLELQSAPSQVAPAPAPAAPAPPAAVAAPAPVAPAAAAPAPVDGSGRIPPLSPPPPPPAALVNLATAEESVYSQNGEDGVLRAIFAAVGTTNKFYVEFGVETCAQCNTRLLRTLGWWGLLLDGGAPDPSINLHTAFITAEGIVGLFQQYDVPRDLDLLSVDIDRNDWHVLRAIIEPAVPGDFATAPFRPRVVVVEYNSDWAPPADKVVKYESSARWDGWSYTSGSIAAFAALGRACGYTVVYADSRGVNLFLVADELGPRARFADAGDEAKIYRPPGFADCQLAHRAGGHCDDANVAIGGKNRAYDSAAALLRALPAWAAAAAAHAGAGGGA